MKVCPSKFYEYLNRNDKNFVKNVLKPALKKILVDQEAPRPRVLFNEGPSVEKYVSNYFRDQNPENIANICSYIEGCCLGEFYLECVKLCKDSPSTVIDAKVKLTVGEIDLIYKDMIIDIKSYRKFALGQIAMVMVQMIVYSNYYSYEPITKLMVYIPTQNRYVYINLGDLDKKLYKDIINRFYVANGIKKNRDCCTIL